MLSDDVEDLVALALAAYHEPVRYHHWWDNNSELTGSMHSLLQLTASNSEFLGIYYKNNPIVKDKLQEAILFFVKQVFFVQDASYYRVLGVAPNASQEQIKDNHRLLIRLFHPDRHNNQGEWSEVYAWRVNQAYNTLRKSDSRRHYDESRQTQAQEFAAIAKPRIISHSNKNVFTPSHNSQNVPYIVLSGLAILALLFVMHVYYSDRRPRLIVSTAETADIHKPPSQLSQEKLRIFAEPELDTTSPASNTQRSFRPSIDYRGSNESTLSTKTGFEKTPESNKSNPIFLATLETPESKPVIKQEPAPVIKQEPALKKKEHYVLDKALRTQSEKRTNDSIEIKKIPGNSKGLSREVSTPHRKKVDVNMLAQTGYSKQPARPIFTERELGILLGRFVRAYERGNLESFMRFFSKNARSGGKRGKHYIREDYKKLFDNTISRRMRFNNIEWLSVGNIMKGRGRFSVEVRTRGEEYAKKRKGQVVFEVGQENGRSIVHAFYYYPDGS
jgi:curved DNA-binding protein CbpA